MANFSCKTFLLSNIDAVSPAIKLRTSFESRVSSCTNCLMVLSFGIMKSLRVNILICEELHFNKAISIEWGFRICWLCKNNGLSFNIIQIKLISCCKSKKSLKQYVLTTDNNIHFTWRTICSAWPYFSCHLAAAIVSLIPALPKSLVFPWSKQWSTVRLSCFLSFNKLMCDLCASSTMFVSAPPELL